MNMKTMKLSSIEDNLLDAKEARAITGGNRICGCACYYRDVGGSSISDNTEANYAGGTNGLDSPQETQDKCYKVDFPDGSTQYF